MSSSRISPADPAAPQREAEEAGGTSFVVMPKMGISVSEGTIVEWRKAVGDRVEADETIAEVTTDKVDVEIPSPTAGVLSALLAEPGDTVEVGETIAEIGGPPAAAAEPSADPPASASGAATTTGPEEVDRSDFFSPVVQRIAAKHGIDLTTVEGTGVGGRVRKNDVVARINDVPPISSASPPGMAGSAERTGAPVLHTESPYRPDEPVPANGNGNGAHGEPMTPMRSAIAKHMVESLRTSAHCTTVVEVDMSEVARRREAQREAMKRRGIRLTPLAFVAEATVAALADHPILNSSIDGEEVVSHDSVHLGIAVALDAGLIVPVIRDAQRLSAEGLAAAIGDLAGRARSGGLGADEVDGATFTITNPGQFGAVIATPIINQPQVAILDFEAIVQRPVAIDDGAGGFSVGVRPIANLCMSWDHRALDGVEAARFLGAVKQRLEAGS